RFIQFGLKVAKDAMEDSGLKDSKDVNYDKFGISCAAGIGGFANIEKNSIITHTRGPKRISPFFIPSALINMLGGFVSIEHNLKGPNLSSSTACAASVHAISEAVKTIAVGVADKMMVVGSESAICETGIGGFAAMKALSTRNDDPKKASRPFDKDRDGFVMGEGAGILILEDYESAKKRGADIYCEVVGYGLSSDAYHLTQPAAGGEGAARCIKMALNGAGLNPEQVDYINAHGTSTYFNDLYETMAIKTVFGDYAQRVMVSSTKGMTGHGLGAAGGMEAAYSALVLKHGIVPPTINYEEPDPECDLDYVPNVARQAECQVALSNSFGFGGTNATLAFRKI
ncbi:MAG: beta-ketoacyl-ACP synthase II, partial [Desulfuromusa sp.]|nr:beta-ketoacyl-ACP synthase II [Desulfuromusa sp.]